MPLPAERSDRATLPLLLILPILLAAGCSGAPAAPSHPACRQPPEAVLPRTAGTLTEADSGTFCLSLGSQLAVFLAPPQGAQGLPVRWSTVVSSAPPVLAATGSATLTAPVGVTPGIFRGATAGEARLTSDTVDGKTWQVIVEVS